MSSTIQELLKKHFVDSEDTVWHTHVSMVQPRGKFQFDRNNIDTLWDVYCDNMNSETIPIVGVAEKPHNYTPVLVDIDIKLEETENLQYGEHLYSLEQVKQIIQIYQSVLRTIVYNCGDSNLTCVLLEKPIYYINTNDKRYVKNGFHLKFPS